MLAALRIKSGITPLPPRVWLPGGWLGLPGQASHLLNYTTLLGRICRSVSQILSRLASQTEIGRYWKFKKVAP
jgi:hypothetical protein